MPIALSLEEEKELVDAAQRDPKAFGQLYDLYLPKLYAFVGYKVNADRSVIEDLTAEIFEKAFRHLATFEWQNLSFGAWLYRIARNHITDYFRTHKTAVSLDYVAYQMDDGTDLHYQVETKVEHQTVQKVIATLPEREQEIIALKFSFGYNNREIAKLMDLSESNVGTLLYRGLKQVKEKLGQAEHSIDQNGDAS